MIKNVKCPCCRSIFELDIAVFVGDVILDKEKKIDYGLGGKNGIV